MIVQRLRTSANDPQESVEGLKRPARYPTVGKDACDRRLALLSSRWQAVGKIGRKLSSNATDGSRHCERAHLHNETLTTLHMGTQPWASGPKEILEHAISLLRKDSDKNRRLALLSVDNAVELTIKTYLGLPKRISGLNVARKDYAEFSESFPKLLDALELYASAKIAGIDLGEIEWFHRLRNQLYHQGNGLTVDKDKVDIYSELARLLFENLFATSLSFDPEDQHQLLGEFLAAWVAFEKMTASLSKANSEKLTTLGGRTRPPLAALNEMLRVGVFDAADFTEIDALRRLRNDVVHGMVDYKTAVSRKSVNRLEQITAKYQEILDSHNDSD